MRNRWLILASGVVLLLGAVYFGSAYFAANNLKTAALSGNADQLDAAIDFPAVRDSLKSQLSAAMMKAMTDDPKMKDNPLAGLGAMLAPAIIDRAIDAFLTPDGIAVMIRTGKAKAGATAEPSEPDPDITTTTEWVNLDRFRVRLHNQRTNQAGPSLLFERRGLMAWKLIRLELPDTMLKPGGPGGPTI